MIQAIIILMWGRSTAGSAPPSQGGGRVRTPRLHQRGDHSPFCLLFSFILPKKQFQVSYCQLQAEEIVVRCGSPFRKSRCTPEVPLYCLKAVNPLYAAQNNVVRQRSAVHREEHFKRLIEFIGFCSTTRYLSLATVSKTEILASSTPG